MNHFLKFGILSITPLTAIAVPYLSEGVARNNPKVTEIIQNSSVNLDEPITLISKNQLNFGSPCEFILKDEVLKKDKQKTFNNSGEFLNYLLEDPEKLTTENWQISLPKKALQALSDYFDLEPLASAQHRQRISFQKDEESQELHNEIFQRLWKTWTSNWDSKSESTKGIIFGIIDSNNLVGKSPRIKQLHKCYNGNWYSIRFDSKLSLEDIEDIDFKHWISNHIGIL